MLDNNAIEELKRIYRNAYGKVLSDEDAMEMGNRLLRVFRILTEPIDGNDDSSREKKGEGS